MLITSRRHKAVLVARNDAGYDCCMTEEKNPAAVALGKLGASKGGKARAEKLTSEEKKAIARKAANARWEKWRREREQDDESS